MTLASSASAQAFRRNPPPENYISVSLQRLLFREIRLNYERTFDEKQSFRFAVGYQWPTDDGSYRNYKPFEIPVRRKLWQGYYLSAGYGYTIVERLDMYVAGYIFYNNRHYDKKLYHNCKTNPDDSEISLESRYESITGITARWGKKLILNKKGDTKVLFDFYAGLGGYFNNINTTVYGKYTGSCNAEDLELFNQPQESTSRNIGGLIIIGIDFGIGF